VSRKKTSIIWRLASAFGGFFFLRVFSMLKTSSALLLLVVAAVGAQASTLEYRFKIGEELVYELVSKEDLLEDEEESDRRYETKARWNVYPIRRNEDGSWHLVVRTWVKALRYDREKAEDGELGAWKAEPYVRLENTFLGYCDIMPDGSYKENPTLGHVYLFELPPELLFPPLPEADPGEEPTVKVAPTSGTTYELKWDSTVDATARLTGSLVRPTSAISEATHQLEVAFDLAAGRVQEIRETDKSVWRGTPSLSRTTYRLVDVISHTSEWMKEFDAAAETYFLDQSAWRHHKSLAAKTRTADACRVLVEEARNQIESKQEAIDVDEVRSAYDGLLALHDREAQWDIEAAARHEAVYSMPPVDWVTTTLSGEPRIRADYAGKIVILDFWYRGCSHCVLAFPKMKLLHSKYQGQDVVVLGVSNDQELEDADYLVRTYAIPYENVRNVMTPASPGPSEPAENESNIAQKERRISSEYKVNVWPTFVVLDQAGRVVEVVDGNAEDLVEHLSKLIDGLLAASPADQ
jgi:cytochrome oxidase Cu insertion factor (SCO1/SenC/PrrC family)